MRCAEHGMDVISYTKRFPCHHPLPGRVVRITKKPQWSEDGILSLCEVVVYGMKIGTVNHSLVIRHSSFSNERLNYEHQKSIIVWYIS